MQLQDKFHSRRATDDEGQGFNDARGEILDLHDVPENNGLNVNNDPNKVRLKEATEDERRWAASRKEPADAKGESEGMSSTGLSCAKCGLPRDDWKENNGQGFFRDELDYCSLRCAALSKEDPQPSPTVTPHV